MSRWRRKGYFYHFEFSVYRGSIKIGSVYKKLGFITYHLIRLFHGEEKLNEMGLDISMIKVLSGQFISDGKPINFEEQ